jgi:hypothetical protein
VAPGLDRDLEVVLARERDGCRDLLGVSRASDGRRAPVVDRVPQSACIVVTGVVGRDDVSA